ncbi:hypothetical protein Tco_1437144 [Tanacetum coccineum]
MVENTLTGYDTRRKAIDPSHYRGMIGILLYLTASRPDLQFAICMCARYQARLIEKHLNTVKRIFQYLKGTVHRGLWYSKDSSIALTAFADADHAGLSDTTIIIPDNGVIKSLLCHSEYQIEKLQLKLLADKELTFDSTRME